MGSVHRCPLIIRLAHFDRPYLFILLACQSRDSCWLSLGRSFTCTAVARVGVIRCLSTSKIPPWLGQGNLRSFLITGAGGSAGNNVCWSLRVSPDGRGIDLIGTDSEKTSLELNRWIDAGYTIPSAKNPRYIQILNKILARKKVQAVFPQPDPEVGRVSRDRHLLNASVF